MVISDILKHAPKTKICLIHNDKKLTYDELDRQSSYMAYNATFIKKGEIIFLQEDHPVRLLLCFFAIIKAGGICVLGSSTLPEKITKKLMEKYQIKIRVQYNNFFNAHKKAVPTVRENDIFLGAMSSGSSTGIPKIIMRDHYSWAAAFPWQSKLFNIDAKTRLYLAGDLSYTANLNACIHTFSVGGCVVIAKNRLPCTWLLDIDKYKINSIFMVPAHYRILLKVCKKMNEKIISLVSGGAKITLDIVKGLHYHFPRAKIVEYYGSSELGHISYAETNDLLQHPESAGKLFPQVKAQIIDNVIWVESPYIVPSLRPKATAGDLGYIDTNGYITLKGRKNGVINVGGVKIQPEQIEALLKKHAFIEDAAVFGIPDKLRGQKIAAAIIPKSNTLTIKEVFHYCTQNVGHPPQKVFFLQNFPLNTNGKIDKFALQKIAMEKINESN